MTAEAPPGGMPGELTLIAVRHGSTELTGQVFNGCSSSAPDPPLNSDGFAQVAHLRRLLTSWGWLDRVDRTVTSSAQRAFATAEELMGHPAEVDSRLGEVDFGQWEGKSPQLLWQDKREQFLQWQRDPGVAPPGGTALNDAAERLRSWREQVHAEVPRGDRAVILAVGHASTVRILVADALGLPLGQISRLAVGPGGAALIRFWADGGSSLEWLIPSLA